MRVVVTVAFWALAVLLPVCRAPRTWAAALVIDPTPLAAPSIREARRLGVVVVGQDTGQAKVAADLVQEWLENARHHVVRLQSVPFVPARPYVANINQTFHLGATAFVRILTPAATDPAAGGSHPNGVHAAVEFRDQEGDAVSQSPGGRGGELPEIQFLLPPPPPPTPPSAPSDESADDDDDEAKPLKLPVMLLHTEHGRPYLGAARLKDDELYRLTGRLDLAQGYRQRKVIKIVAGSVGTVAIAFALTYTVLAGILDIGSGWAAEGEPSNSPSSLHKAFPIAAISAGAGAALIGGAILLPMNPLDGEERQQLMHEFNSRMSSDAPPAPPRPPVALSVAPLAVRANDALLLGGQLRLSF